MSETRGKTITFLEEKEEEYLCGFRLDRDFLNRTQKAQTIQGKIFNEMH